MLRAIVIATTVLCVRPAAAEINVVDAIEWATADAELVVRGRITDLAHRRGPGDVVWFDAVIAVDETIKGAASGTIHVRFRQLGGSTLPALHMRKADLLLFLVSGKRLATLDRGYEGAPLAPRDGSMSSVVELGATHVYDADFAVLAKAADVLASVRAAASSTATSRFHLDVPYDAPAFKELRRGSGVWLYVPVDAALEHRADLWLATNDVRLRTQAVEALVAFRSDANVARLQLLLADPAFELVTRYEKRAQREVRERRYPVREAADRVLKAWTVNHAPPTVVEPAPG